ncbi:enoyl-CoA hydratase-related protein [Alkalicoccus chagannorensis]|uniref:enoyl-CoA hydratase-related protein n=1 Tax=Alkalicoccus chagannorensis TaxID=427072 RepID=UPI000428359D|nr:enoyl-CoA hydratase-related protein [Alkalicoccus chagannorensis]
MIKTMIEGYTATAVIDRPEAANALSKQVLEELSSVLASWAGREDIRCVILTGSGAKVFSAGADLKERAQVPESEVWTAVSSIRSLIEQVYAMPKPVIAALNGAAFGGGLELAAACDFRIGRADSTFTMSETGLGIIPGGGGTQRLPRLIGEQNAKAMILAGRSLNGEEAVSTGLFLCTSDNPYAAAQELAQDIAARAPLAVQYAKQAVNSGLQVPLDEGMKIEEREYKKTIGTEDRREGLNAFKEKRKPHYEGK